MTETASHRPSCSPDRLLTWDDFSKKDPPSERPAAQTAIRFLLQDTPPHFVAKFDPSFSWVKTKVANPARPSEWFVSERLLAHEQVHFLISCLLVREANHSVKLGEDLQKTLELVKSVAQRINVQYDNDTKHGTDESAQEEWEFDVQQQFEDVTLKGKTKMADLQMSGP